MRFLIFLLVCLGAGFALPASAEAFQQGSIERIAREIRTRPLAEVFPAEAFSPGVSPERPFSTAAFTLPPNARSPEGVNSGELTFAGEAADHFTLYKDDFNYVAAQETARSLPPFAIELVLSGGDVIPLARGPLRGEHPDWEWVFEPGAAWTLPDAPGVTYIALPFALVERNANCTHNGLLAFRLNVDGAPSNIIYQIGSETCAYTQFDLWGAGEVRWDSRDIPSAPDVIVAYEREKAARLETRRVAEITGVDPQSFGSPDDVPPEAMTLFGYVDGAVHYVGGCATRFGDYPYCDVLDLPSYSWAKSIVAGVGLMRLEKLYPGVMNEKISDYVPACGEIWAGVTFENALDMATGHYNSDGDEVDEGGAAMQRFFFAETHAEKIDIACKAFARRTEPGRKFVYRTGDTYILGTAMNAFLRTRTGRPDADYYRDLIVPIWRALGLSPVMMDMRRTRDEATQAFTGWGLTMHRNDVALILNFLRSGGVIGGEALLDRRALDAALQRPAGPSGLEAVIPSQRYQNGFWAWNAGPSIGCKGDAWVPALSGYGGLAAALLPNGASYYYISDGNNFTWRRAAAASNKLKPFCEAGQ